MLHGLKETHVTRDIKKIMKKDCKTVGCRAKEESLRESLQRERELGHSSEYFTDRRPISNLLDS